MKQRAMKTIRVRITTRYIALSQVMPEIISAKTKMTTDAIIVKMGTIMRSWRVRPSHHLTGFLLLVNGGLPWHSFSFTANNFKGLQLT